MRNRIRRRKKEIPYLNLISLMDMFTILVIFLLFQVSNEGEVLSVAKDVILPVSTASQSPRRAITVTVTAKEILVEGTSIAQSQIVSEEEDPVIAPLRERLLGAGAKKVTILGDRKVPFALLKKVMVTCTDAGIDQISLAVLSKES
jgi:biopolymer transport protein ExbD